MGKVNYLRTEWRTLSDRVAADLEFMARKLSGEIYVVSRTKADNRWVVAHVRAEAPTEYHQWAIDEGVTTADQVAIMGGSYGGYATLVGLTFTPETFACGVDIVGMSNMKTTLDSIPPYWASGIERIARGIGDPRTAEGRAQLKALSPLFKADQIVKPLLIAQGANDPRVKRQ